MFHPHQRDGQSHIPREAHPERVWDLLERSRTLRMRAQMAECAANLLDPETMAESSTILDDAVDHGVVRWVAPVEATVDRVVDSLAGAGTLTDIVECVHAADRLITFGSHLDAEGAPVSADLADPTRRDGVAWFLEGLDEPCECDSDHALVTGIVWTTIAADTVRAATIGWWPPQYDELGFSDGRYVITSFFDLADDHDLPQLGAAMTWRVSLLRGLLGTHDRNRDSSDTASVPAKVAEDL